MNDRIKLLWEEAAKTTQGDSWEEQTKFMERYTELIVRECASVAFRFSIDNKRIHPDIDPKDMPEANQVVYHSTCQAVGFEIREHFGVE